MGKIVSKKIKALENAIKEKNSEFIETFWKEIREKGAPLIEEVDENNVLITFLYKAEQQINNIIIYGAFPSYRYSENMLERILDTNIWFKTYKVRNDIKFKYNFSVNDALDDDYKNRKKNLILDTLNPNKITFMKDDEDLDSIDAVYSLVELSKVKSEIWTKEKEGINKGDLIFHRFESRNMANSRRIWVYTPYNYDTKSEPKELIILTDGFDHLNYLSALNVLNNLINENKISETVCVFIDCSEDRFNTLTCNNKFSEFIANEIIPWIYDNYNVSHESDKISIGGVSLGGLTAAYLGLKHHDIFGNVLAQSASFWWNEGWLIKQYENIEKLPLRFYLNVGYLEDRPYDDEPVMADYINKMRDTLLEKDYEVYYEQFGSGHDYLSWGETLANGLIALRGKKTNN